jgi:carbamoyl-phosphate synthase large subunit
MADEKTVVLVTAVGGSGAVDVARSLSETGRYRVVAADVSEYAAGFAFADATYVVPMGGDPAFEGAAREILRRERPDFVVTSVDEEIPVFHRLVAEDATGHTRVLTPRPEFCRLAHDKWECTRALEAAGVPVPRTYLAGDVAGDVYPAVVKPRTGRGSRGVAYPESAAELAEYLETAPGSPSDYVVQERVFGTEYTVSAVVGLGGPLLAVVPKEVLVKKGITHSAVTRDVPAIDEVCRRIQEELRADGPFNVQLMLAPDGVPYVFEVNPRFSTTVSLTMGSGVDEVDAIMRHALGQDPGNLRFQPDLIMLRHYAQQFVPESRWRAGADG